MNPTFYQQKLNHNLFHLFSAQTASVVLPCLLVFTALINVFIAKFREKIWFSLNIEKVCSDLRQMVFTSI